MSIVLSGIRPTGNLHLGNYFGALRNFVKLQDANSCYFFIADFHSLTTHPKAEGLSDNVRRIMALYLAAGIDTEKSTLYVQSDMSEVCELYLIFNMLAYVGELERTVTFKEKIRLHPDNINAGLLTYQVLMAADILIHRSNFVPVGKDQEQHLEMARIYARRFNNLYGSEVFPEPAAFNFGDDLVKVPGLNGTGKMGKSEGNGIFLTDSEDEIRKKVMRAVTDSGPTEPNQMPTEPIQNLFTIMDLVSSPDTLAFFKEQYASCSIRYGDLKKQLAADINSFVAPIRERYNDIINDDALLLRARELGREKAKASAAATLKAVREAMKL